MPWLDQYFSESEHRYPKIFTQVRSILALGYKNNDVFLLVGIFIIILSIFLKICRIRITVQNVKVYKEKLHTQSSHENLKIHCNNFSDRKITGEKIFNEKIQLWIILKERYKFIICKIFFQRFTRKKCVYTISIRHIRK